MYYSPSQVGFYDDPEKYTNSPTDLVQISDELYDRVSRNRPSGKIVVTGPDGLPDLADPPPPPPPTLDQLLAMRLSEYLNESDPLKNEAEYDAMVSGREPDYTAWMAKVAEIKARYPIPADGQK